MTRSLIFSFILFLSAVVLLPESPVAQTVPEDIEAQIDEWNEELEIVERIISYSDLTSELSQSLTLRLQELIQTIRPVRSQIETRVQDINTTIEALGPPPEGEDAPPEPDPIAAERERLNDLLGRVRSSLALADLAIARARSLENQIGAARRNRLVQHLSIQGPLPFELSTVREAVTVLANYLSTVGDIYQRWWDGIAARPDSSRVLVIGGLVVLAGFGAALWLRREVLRRFGHYDCTEPPPYSRRLIGAVADGVAKGILPAAILIVIIARAQSESAAIYGEFGTLVELAAINLMIFILVTALPDAVLSPNDPNWRLTELPPEKGRRIMKLVTPLALLFCVDEFVVRAAESIAPLTEIVTPAFLSLWTFVFNLAQGIIALALLRPSLWTTGRSDQQPETEDAETDEDETEASVPRRRRRPFWNAVHLGLVITTFIGTVTPVAGFTNLGNYLLNNILGTAVVIAILYILRGLFREAVGMATGSALVKDRLQVSHSARSRYKIVARFLLDLLILVAGLSVVAPNWGVSEADMFRILGDLATELKIGEVTISLTDIVLAIIVFIVALGLIQALKRSLSERILPETEIEESVRHSITAGTGYVGFVVAAALAIAVAGVDLTNIALIAGALSVGIGFGLQNIVNNFVSGMILLIERPIKVGDWVVVGPNEGFVKQINMRATEIETWQRASVIVPNADLLSQALTNWTHKDKVGRVEVPIGVALDTDIQKACDILLEVGKAHPRCRRYPEPVALVLGVGESRIQLELRIFTSDILWVLWIASDIRKDILKRFREEGIVIPYAQRVVHMVEGDPMGPRIQNPPPDPVTGPGSAKGGPSSEDDLPPR
ncbi:MAG: mechanosensitive ion channel [Alphaproteobacteria bacterium]